MNSENLPGASVDRVRYPIGIKLIAIITIIVLVSLGSITVLVSALIREDLRISAEDNNFEVNRRAAMWTDVTFKNIRSNSLVLLQTVGALEKAGIAGEQTINMFYRQNPDIAAIFFASGEEISDLMINRTFFHSGGMELSLVDSFIDTLDTSLARAASGETLFINAALFFRTSLLAMMFPWENTAVTVLFSPGTLSDTYTYGTNQSFLINSIGDILVHADSSMVQNAVNVANRNFAKLIWESHQGNAQVVYTDEEGVDFFMAYTKLYTGGAVVVTNIEYNRVFEGIAATTRRNIYLTAAVLCISVMFIWFFSKSISVPLKELAAAAQAIEGGDFDVKLRPRGRDEIGLLTSGFQRMSNALGIFGKFTNREIALRAMRNEIKPGGQLKHATILYSGVLGFAEKSENFAQVYGEDASNRIVSWLNNCLTGMAECVENTSGVVDKFIGNALLAHWGTAFTSGSPEKDAFSCIAAVLVMRENLVEMNRERGPDDSGNPPVRIGCGIDSGMVTVGQIGSNLRVEYTVIGDPVNNVSRIESLCEPLGADILVTEETWNMVNDQFIAEEMPPLSVKGREKPLRLFAVINFSGIDMGPRTLAELRELLNLGVPDMSKAGLNINE